MPWTLDALRCRYTDCIEAHPLAGDDDRVTCATCRDNLALPALDPCPMCGHGLATNAHDGDDGTGCAGCDDAAEVGTYAPCQSYDDGQTLIAGVLYDADTLQEV